MRSFRQAQFAQWCAAAVTKRRFSAPGAPTNAAALPALDKATILSLHDAMAVSAETRAASPETAAHTTAPDALAEELLRTLLHRRGERSRLAATSALAVTQQETRAMTAHHTTVDSQTRGPDPAASDRGLQTSSPATPTALPRVTVLEGRNLRRLGRAALGDAIIEAVSFARADLRGADLSCTVFRGCNFDMANLAGANLCNSTFAWCSFAAADADGVDLRSAKLRGCNLQRASLRGARVQGAIFHECDFTRSTLEGAVGVGSQTVVLEPIGWRRARTRGWAESGCKVDLGEGPSGAAAATRLRGDVELGHRSRRR